MGAFLCWLGVRVLEMHRVLKPTGSLYLHCDHTAAAYLKTMLDAVFGARNFQNEVVWHYGGGGASKKRFGRKHDTILFYTKSTTSWTFNVDAVRVPHKWVDGQLRADGSERSDKGKIPDDVIVMHSVMPWAGERTGYPTQKPLALYERIIKASSNPGDTVLDPFAGCATTCVAAERLGRQWVGIDLNEPARDIIRDRLQREVSESMAWDTIVQTPTVPPTRTDGGEAVVPELVVVSRKRNARRLPVREIRDQLVISDGQRCQGCGWEPAYPDYLQVDHKKPRSLGGRDDMDNLTLLCDPCNRFKSNKLTLTELRQARVDEGRVDADWWKEERWR